MPARYDRAFRNGRGGPHPDREAAPRRAATRRCRGVAAEHLYDDRCRVPASSLDVIGADIPIIARRKFGRPRRVGRCPRCASPGGHCQRMGTRRMPRTSPLAPRRPRPRCLRLGPR